MLRRVGKQFCQRLSTASHFTPCSVRTLSQWTVGDKLSKSPKCDPYELGGKKLEENKVDDLMKTISSKWKVEDDTLLRSFHCETFQHAAHVANKICVIATNGTFSPSNLMSCSFLWPSIWICLLQWIGVSLSLLHVYACTCRA